MMWEKPIVIRRSLLNVLRGSEEEKKKKGERRRIQKSGEEIEADIQTNK